MSKCFNHVYSVYLQHVALDVSYPVPSKQNNTYVTVTELVKATIWEILIL